MSKEERPDILEGHIALGEVDAYAGIPRIATFEKVSFEQFAKDFNKCFDCRGRNDNDIKNIYDGIKLPTRGTIGSAGYDFYSPYSVGLWPWKTCVVPTGIRVKMEPGWVLILAPKSGIGTSQSLRLVNTTGVIDSDYYHGENEGHIHAPLRRECASDGDSAYYVAGGEKFMQGVFMPYGITTDDTATERRLGGFGSTGRFAAPTK